ncbi:MAG TPA: GNAT family N-acetyltransferase [Streptosporangiaceae bacterium]|nr:GNAT family N-acetyltransferase [Streptosporangiaceae bacterium]
MNIPADSITVRQVTPGDVRRINELIRMLAEHQRAADQAVATADDLHAALFASHPSLFGHVADCGGYVVGFTLWFLSYSTWVGKHGIHLEDICVMPEMRGRGVGRALLAELASICVQRGYGRLDWSVLRGNESAIGFCQSVGAEAMPKWNAYRLSGRSLADLAGK